MAKTEDSSKPIVPQPTKTGKRVTIRDLARELSLSDRAVSQALSPRESNVKLRPETIKRVQDLAAKMGYQPDSRARSMRYGKFFNIGYFEAKKTATALPLPGAEAGVFEAASENGYRVVLIRLPSDLADNPADIPHVFKEGLLDVLILSHAGNLPPSIVQRITVSGYPVVYLNEKLDFNSVYSEDVHGFSKITNFLIEQGRKKIVFIQGINDGITHHSETDRRNGYLDAIEKAGLEPMIVKLGETRQEFEQELPLWFEPNKDNIDAIMTSNDFNTMGALRILWKYRSYFPDKIALTGYDDMGEFMSPLPLTTMKMPFYQMGRAAVEMALEMANNDQKTLPSRTLAPDLIVRASTPSL